MTRAVALSLKIFTGLICLVDQVTWQKYFATSLGSHSEALPLCLHLPRGTLPWLHAIRHRLHSPGGSKRRHLKGCTIASNLRRDQSGNRRLRTIVFAVLPRRAAPRRAVQFVARTLGPCGGFAEIKGIEAFRWEQCGGAKFKQNIGAGLPSQQPKRGRRLRGGSQSLRFPRRSTVDEIRYVASEGLGATKRWMLWKYSLRNQLCCFVGVCFSLRSSSPATVLPRSSCRPPQAPR